MTGPDEDDLAPPGLDPELLDMDALLASRDIDTLLCCGSGGVGKTTMAAALAVRAAELGRTVVVITIDPAHRLAQSIGLEELGNEPRAIDGIDTSAGGRLDAMMLDMKRTFDELVVAHSDAARAQQILDNPFYQSLSSSFAGTQEYMAMEKLGQLRARGEWDLIVVDTPPSRSALDFLDAPKRLGSFLDGRFIRLLTAPGRAGGRAYLRVMSAGMSMVTSAVSRLLGAELLKDVSTLLNSLDSIFGGFRQRAEKTYAALKDPRTAFLVVATPQRDALREAAYFVERLEHDGMPIAGLILNRVHDLPPSALGAGTATELADQISPERVRREGELDPVEFTANLLRVHAATRTRADEDARRARAFTSGHPDVKVATAPAFPGDVHSLESLRLVAAALAGE